MTRPNAEAAIEQMMLALVAEREQGKTCCPSEIARALGGPHPDDWGPLMQSVRCVAVRLAKEGRVVILRKGKPLPDPDSLRGIYRLGPLIGRPMAEEEGAMQNAAPLRLVSRPRVRSYVRRPDQACRRGCTGREAT